MFLAIALRDGSKKFITFAQVWFLNRIGDVLEHDIWSRFKRVIETCIKNNDEWWL